MSTTEPALSSSTSESLKASTFQRLHPKIYLERFLAESVRPDGRTFTKFRPLSVNVGSISTAEGSALVRLGDTTVVCGVKAEIAEPDLDRPEDGFLVPNLDLPALCSPKFKPGPPSEEAQVLSDRLNDALVMSNVLPTKSLCIHPGKSVWVLYVDATCINCDGNVFDATLLAMVAALKSTRLPTPTYNEESHQTTCSRKTKIPLQLTRTLVSASFGIFDSAVLLVDPTSFEEPLLSTTITIVLDETGRLVSVNQLGPGISAQDDVLSRCIGYAKARSVELVKHIQSI